MSKEDNNMAAKGSLEAIIEVAKAEIGTIEGPKDNETKYGKWTGANFLPWCQSFVSWCAYTSGLDAKKYPKTAATVAASDWFKKNGRWADARNDDPTPGDWIYFDFPDDGVNRISHVGLCIKNNGDGTIQVIEGNTSGTAKGDQRNGGMCVEKTRAYVKHKTLMNAVVGWGRPVYAGEENAPLLSKGGVVAESTPTPAKKAAAKPVAKPTAFKALKSGSKGTGVKTVQTLLGIKADGSFGPGTAKAVQDFQKKSGLPATGIVDQATLKSLKAGKQ
jgi:hypothetical protein